MLNSGHCVTAYLCAELHFADGGGLVGSASSFLSRTRRSPAGRAGPAYQPLP
jgi:hypothetical protein